MNISFQFVGRVSAKMIFDFLDLNTQLIPEKTSVTFIDNVVVGDVNNSYRQMTYKYFLFHQ